MPFYSFLSDMSSGFVLLIVLGLAALWVFQFIALMSLGDDRFTGQYVRLGWVAAFLVLWALAPIAFLIWNRGATDRRSAVVHAYRERSEKAD